MNKTSYKLLLKHFVHCWFNFRLQVQDWHWASKQQTPMTICHLLIVLIPAFYQNDANEILKKTTIIWSSVNAHYQNDQLCSQYRILCTLFIFTFAQNPMQQNTIPNFIHKSPAIILRQSFNILTAYSLCFFVNKGLHIQSECAGCQQQNTKSSRRLAPCNTSATRITPTKLAKTTVTGI